MRNVQLMQGSEGWLEWRRAGLGASDAPVITGRSKWRTPYALYLDKLGLAEPQAVNYAMRRGIDLEPRAREVYEQLTGNIMQPQCLEHPELSWLRASLDGIDLNGELALEIKCPGKEDHKLALDGQVPPGYVDQCAHILAVTGAELLHYYSFDGERGVLVEVKPESAAIEALIDVETAFWQRVQRLEPPAMTDRDFVAREDADWMTAANNWETANAAAKAAAETAEAWRQRLCELAGANSARGGGVRVTRYMEHGRISYAQIPALKELDLNAYRGAPSLRWRVTNGQGHDT